MKKKFFLILTAIVFCTNVVHSQVEPMCFIKGNNNSLLYNPGKRAFYDYYIGIGLSNVNLNFYSTLVSYNDLIIKGDDGYKYLNHAKIIQNLKNKNFTSLNLDLNLFDFGISIKQKTYLGISARLNSETYVSLPGEALSYILQGNANYIGEKVKSKMFCDHNTYLEAGILLQHEYEVLTVGVRPKILLGVVNAKINEAYLSFYTDTSWGLHFGGMADFSLSMFNDMDLKSMLYAVTTSKNFGFGMDFGVSVKLPFRFGLNASVLDLGYINWKQSSMMQTNYYRIGVNKNNKNYQDGYLTFNGVNYEFIDSMINGKSSIDNLVDSIQNLFEIDSVYGKSYRSDLTPKIFTELNYSISKNHMLHLLARANVIHENLRTSLVAAYSGRILSFLDLAASYTIYNSFGRGNVLGLGVNFHLGAINMYLSAYNIGLKFKSGEYQWKDLHSVALQLGFYFAGNVNRHKDKTP